MRKRYVNGWMMALLAGLACGCSNQDTDHLSRICHKAVGRMEEMAGGTKGNVHKGWEAFRASFGDMTLDSRVASRLHWEKTLSDVHVHVQVVKPGVVRLHGQVREFQQRIRAQDVALSTLGVDNVINELTVVVP
jgi:osmotically-inducible protein OsmY